MMNNRRTRRARRKGVITVLVAVCLIAVLAIMALSVDGGRLLDARRQAKAAADAAARGAAIELLDMTAGTNPNATLATVRASALEIAAANGYTNDGQESTVTVNIPPTSGQYAGQDGYIEVLVEIKQQRAFSRLLGTDPISVGGRSVAVGTFVPSKGSVVVLNKNKSNALALGKGTSVLKADGDVAVNSTSKKGPLQISKGAQIEADNVLLAGSIPKKQMKSILQGIRGELTTRAPPADDPFVNVAVPQPGTTRKLSNYKTNVNGADTYDLQPGRYTEEWKFDHNDVVNLAPGTYYLDNKRIDFKGSTVLRGDSVTIYSSGKAEVRFHTKGEIHLTPPTSGPYAGISIFKDPQAKGKITFDKTTNLDISGAIYAPKSMVRFNHSDANLGDDDDESAWDDLTDLDDALSGDEVDSAGSIGANIVSDMLKIDKHSSVTIHGANLNIRRPLLGLVE